LSPRRPWQARWRRLQVRHPTVLEWRKPQRRASLQRRRCITGAIDIATGAMGAATATAIIATIAPTAGPASVSISVDRADITVITVVAGDTTSARRLIGKDRPAAEQPAAGHRFFGEQSHRSIAAKSRTCGSEHDRVMTRRQFRSRKTCSQSQALEAPRCQPLSRFRVCR